MMRRNGFEVSLQLSGHLDAHRTGINHSSTAATKLQIRAFWTSAWDGNSQRCVAESTQRRTTEESISSKKQALGTFQTWRRSGLLRDEAKAKVRAHTSKAGFTEELWCWRRARKSMKKTDPENHARLSGSLTRNCDQMCP